MAPSTANPSDLHRASVACLQCRKAKVRCLVSHRLDRCNRCVANDTQCVFTHPKRAKTRPQPYPPPARREPMLVQEDQGSLVEKPANSATLAPVSEYTPAAQTPITASPKTTPVEYILEQALHQQPLITNAIRAKIVAGLASLKGKRGSAFTFLTSENGLSISATPDPDPPAARSAQRERQSAAPPSTGSINLLSLLRPLTVEPRSQSNDVDERPIGMVKMPSYMSSMTLGQTVADPIEAGIINLAASQALFAFFMLQLNAKWEYILDPRYDSHDGVRERSSLLFSTVLYCASKFTNYRNGQLLPGPDSFLLTRLCSVARNLSIKSLAQGSRAIETMQTFYLLACWKDVDDDVSYLHSGYAIRVLQDVDFRPGSGDSEQTAKCRRAWLALFRQDRQQSLFFIQRAPLGQASDDLRPDTWLQMPNVLPSDVVASSSADVRRVQSKLLAMVDKASATMLPCLVGLMDAELAVWAANWKSRLGEADRSQRDDDPYLSPGMLLADKQHLNTLLSLWEHSVKLNVASAILRRALMSALAPNLDSGDSSLDIDLLSIQRALSPDLAGLTSSMDGALGTLHSLLKIPGEDLRRAPDAVLLLAPNAALFLCLLLCLPENGVLNAAFQATAVGMIRNMSQHVRDCVQSPQDTVALHSAYLESLVELLEPPGSQCPPSHQDPDLQRIYDTPQIHADSGRQTIHNHTLQNTQALTEGISLNNYAAPLSADDQNVHLQGLANLIDGDLFWEIPAPENVRHNV
ncbi:uncharacterized protein BDV17DRAFT_284072 [Aspergillus undulatus]|uniref:uncharacterized protein n=1 Tax=Aspergillus undulatus TaxID=1810928 RepID=UPI003CCE3037